MPVRNDVCACDDAAVANGATSTSSRQASIVRTWVRLSVVTFFPLAVGHLGSHHLAIAADPDRVDVPATPVDARIGAIAELDVARIGRQRDLLFMPTFAVAGQQTQFLPVHAIG